MLATGTLSANLDPGPDPAFAARIKQSVAGIGPAREARASVPVAGTPDPGPSEAPSAPPPPTGVWQIQVGAFRSSSAAEAHLRSLESELPELARLNAAHQLRGRINRVRIGGIEDEGTARALCERILETGRGCFVARPEG